MNRNNGPEPVQLPRQPPLTTPADVRDRRTRGLLLLAMLVAVVAVDQAGKWWGWRHAPSAQINSGGDPLIGPTIGGWYAQPVPGAFLDLLSSGLLGTGARALVRSGRPLAVLASGALTISGWSSNLLDRLGMHYLTAPGSPRGAVDFIPIGTGVYNVADFVIGGGTVLLAVAAIVGRVNRAPRAVLPRREPAPRPVRRNARTPAWIAAAAAVASLLVLVSIGASSFA